MTTYYLLDGQLMTAGQYHAAMRDQPVNTPAKRFVLADAAEKEIEALQAQLSAAKQALGMSEQKLIGILTGDYGYHSGARVRVAGERIHIRGIDLCALDDFLDADKASAVVFHGLLYWKFSAAEIKAALFLARAELQRRGKHLRELSFSSTITPGWKCPLFLN